MNHIPVLLDAVLGTIVGADIIRPIAAKRQLYNRAKGAMGQIISAPTNCECAKAEKCLQGKTIVDCTFGAGGYSRAFLERGASVIAFDRDPSVQKFADELSREFPGKFQFINAPFSEIGSRVPPLLGGAVRRSLTGGGSGTNISEPSPPSSPSATLPPKRGETRLPDAIVFDFGVSSMQIDTPERGFSWRFDAALDMRMSQIANSKQQTANELIKNSSVSELARILREYGDVKKAGPIARALKDALPQTTFQLRDLIYNPKDIAPVFQALRIAVNDELGEIARALAAVPDLLSVGGKCVCVTFHSLEDRLVKNTFRQWTTPAGDPRFPAAPAPFELLKTIRPSETELSTNPRARSAHLRAVRKI